MNERYEWKRKGIILNITEYSGSKTSTRNDEYKNAFIDLIDPYFIFYMQSRPQTPGTRTKTPSPRAPVPIKTEPPTNWFMRWVVGLTVGPTFVLSGVYSPWLFTVLAIIMNTVALSEFSNCILCMYPEDYQTHKPSKYFFILLGDILIISTIFTTNIHIIFTLLGIYFPLLILFQMLHAYRTKVWLAVYHSSIVLYSRKKNCLPKDLATSQVISSVFGGFPSVCPAWSFSRRTDQHSVFYQ